MNLSTVSNKTWPSVEETLNSWNRANCIIASAGAVAHGSIQLNRKSIGIKKRLACTMVSYANFARNMEDSQSAPEVKAEAVCFTIQGLRVINGDPGEAHAKAHTLNVGQAPAIGDAVGGLRTHPRGVVALMVSAGNWLGSCGRHVLARARAPSPRASVSIAPRSQDSRARENFLRREYPAGRGASNLRREKFREAAGTSSPDTPRTF